MKELLLQQLKEKSSLSLQQRNSFNNFFVNEEEILFYENQKEILKTVTRDSFYSNQERFFNKQILLIPKYFQILLYLIRHNKELSTLFLTVQESSYGVIKEYQKRLVTLWNRSTTINQRSYIIRIFCKEDH